ncbi:phosphate ABC transporter substrate-binding protein PstS family protein [Bombilactobacillus folatiphilus]|uniref:Phosphate-binding protein n=1 Tax=Bombilactobacillus folatiphilus TaxID=2923362 RepID=A0ABY4P7S9_9LACO|nr:phosphate ABC transporter substrate-binding protein PstS family protein [Bombilactobacillus folatiphilus]UQS81692.1 phosphate ABC transporter substrate-binding protein PstS family protein [Bombilactobacillus folatiphilus]
MKKLMQYLGVLGVGLLILSGCAKSPGSKEQTITAVGSSALQPLVEAAGENYNQIHPNAFVTVQGGGSGTGLSQIQQGAVAIGNSDVFAEQKKGIKAQNLIDHKVCVVAVVPVVNKQVAIKNLSLSQLQAIFAGEITNWREVGGPNLQISLVNRAQGSGTRTVFEQQVMQGRTSKRAPEQDSSGMVRQIVKKTPGAISYVALPYLSSDLKPLTVDHVAVTAKNVQNNRWKIWSYEHMYTTKNLNQLTKDFIRYLLSDKFQQNEVRKMRYIPIKAMRYQQNAQGQTTKL